MVCGSRSSNRSIVELHQIGALGLVTWLAAVGTTGGGEAEATSCGGSAEYTHQHEATPARRGRQRPDQQGVTPARRGIVVNLLGEDSSPWRHGAAAAGATATRAAGEECDVNEGGDRVEHVQKRRRRGFPALQRIDLGESEHPLDLLLSSTVASDR